VTDQTWQDRIVAEFGDGHPVEQIAARYGITVAQVYAVIQREVSGPAPEYYGPPPGPGWQSPHPPQQYPPQAYPPQAYPPQPYAVQVYPPGFRDPDAIVAEYSEGHDVRLIAGRHALTVEQVYAMVRQALGDSPQ
jgi:transposase-like protein